MREGRKKGSFRYFILGKGKEEKGVNYVCQRRRKAPERKAKFETDCAPVKGKGENAQLD